VQLDQITFTRFVAALTVVFFHYGNQAFPLTIPYLENVLKAGPIAVNYFYLLSGFIMAIAYYQPTGKQTLNKKKYWIARFARIYPLYLLALLLVAIPKYNAEGVGTALSYNLSLLQAWIPGYPLTLNAPGWSLSVEAFFYLCFPFLLVLVHKNTIKQVALVTVLFWLLTQAIHIYLLNSPVYQPLNAIHDFIYYNPMMHLSAFMLGILAGACFKRKSHFIQRLRPYSTQGIITTTLTASLLIAFQPQLIQILSFEFAFTNGLLAPILLLFIIFLGLNTGRIAQVLSHKWLIILGEASFSLYILQRPVYGIYHALLGSKIDLSEQQHFYLYIVLLIIISLLSFKFFEAPSRKLIRRLYQRWEKKQEKHNAKNIN
jgi:peptidoglycan/LPS O-acetylase OafA/YrhL